MADFADRVYEYVAMIPRGRVMTYGQLAALCGSPRAARMVGGVAHFGPEDLPWHRVVNKHGGLASSFPGGRTEHAERLKGEGVMISEELTVNINLLLYNPQQHSSHSGSNEPL